MAALAQHLELRVLELGQVGRLAFPFANRQIDAEPLARDGVAVLEAGIAHVPLLHAGGRGQLLGDEGGVGAVLLDVQPEMLARAGGQLQRQLGHEEILVEAFQRGAGAAVGIGLGPGRQGGVVGVGHEGAEGTRRTAGRAVWPGGSPAGDCLAARRAGCGAATAACTGSAARHVGEFSGGDAGWEARPGVEVRRAGGAMAATG